MSNENRVKEKDCAIHDWYRFVLSFPPHLVQEYIQKFNITSNDLVLDPFCGTGTTNVECKKNGIPSVGIEASPLTFFASATKCRWIRPDPEMYDEAAGIAERARRAISSCTIPRRLSEEQNKLLLKNSISEEPLSQVLILRDTIRCAQSIYEDYYLLALAKHIVFSYSNLKFGPEVGVSRKKRYSVDVVGIWLEQIKTMLEDLEQYFPLSGVPARILHGDARAIHPAMCPQKVNYVITSPPYPNEKDYSRTTRLESVLLGYINTKEELRSVKKTFLRSNTKNVYKDDDDFKYIENISSIRSLSAAIEGRRIELNKTSGFEKLYAKVVQLYFGGMARHLIQMKTILASGAKLAYVVGDQASYFKIPIKTAELLAEVAESAGYQVLGIDPFRKRYATATGTWLNEDVLLLRYKEG